jgi:hypothetical protein
MTTGTPQAANITPHAGEDLIGDHYDETIALTWDQLADRVQQDLYDVRGDHMLPATAEFHVEPDTGGSVPVLRITITGLTNTPNDPGLDQIYDAMRVAFGLTNHYNRLHLNHPERPRFVQHITVQRPDGTAAIALVGMMHDAVHTTEPHAQPAEIH